MSDVSSILSDMKQKGISRINMKYRSGDPSSFLGYVDKEHKTVRKFSDITEAIGAYAEILRRNNDNEGLENLFKCADNLTKNVVSISGKISVEYQGDTSEHCYVFFKNRFAEVSEAGVELLEYSVMKRYIWENEIIQHDIEQVDIERAKQSEYFRFLKNVSGGGDKVDLFMQAIGYLLHRYKDPSNPRIVKLADHNGSGQPNGGTGKGIFAKAIGKMLNMVTLDGKTMDFSNQFCYQRVERDTKIIHIEDVNKSFKLEPLFSVSTDGMNVEKKFQNQFLIPEDQSPKFIVTTNYPLYEEGTSYQRRLLTLPFMHYYNLEYTPRKEFGHNLFEGWNKDEWNLFYNLMCYASHYYLKTGLSLSTQIQIDPEEIAIQETSEELVRYVQSEVKEDVEINLKDLYKGFNERYPGGYNYQRTFTQDLKKYAKIMGFKFNQRKSGADRFCTLASK